MADYLDDASVVQPGVYRKDRQEIQSSMAGAFAGPLKGSRVIDQPQDVRFLNEDTAIVISEGGIVFPGTERRARARSGPRGCWPSATAAGMSRPTTTAPRTRDRDTRRLPWFCGKPPRIPGGLTGSSYGREWASAEMPCPPGTALIV